jgi:hypothetical protein
VTTQHPTGIDLGKIKHAFEVHAVEVSRRSPGNPGECETDIMISFSQATVRHDARRWVGGRVLQIIRHPDVEHIHCNFEISVHPNLLRTYGLENLVSRGWKVAPAIHSVFHAHGFDSGKIIFLGVDPARTYDIVWYHNSDVAHSGKHARDKHGRR